MPFLTTPQPGFDEDDSDAWTEAPLGFAPKPTNPWSGLTGSSGQGAASSLVASDTPRWSLAQPGAAHPWSGLLKGLNAAADAFADAVQNGGRQRNAALAKGLDAATQVINGLNRPPSAQAMAQALGRTGRPGWPFAFVAPAAPTAARPKPPGYDIDPGFYPDDESFPLGEGRTPKDVDPGIFLPAPDSDSAPDWSPGAAPIGRGRSTPGRVPAPNAGQAQEEPRAFLDDLFAWTDFRPTGPWSGGAWRPARYPWSGTTPPIIGEPSQTPTDWRQIVLTETGLPETWRGPQLSLTQGGGQRDAGDAEILYTSSGQADPSRTRMANRPEGETATAPAETPLSGPWPQADAATSVRGALPAETGQGHPADPPAYADTFPRKLAGPVIPEPGDIDPATGRIDTDKLFSRAADRMVHGATGFAPASYAVSGQPPRELTPDYLDTATGARVPGDFDAQTAKDLAREVSGPAPQDRDRQDDDAPPASAQDAGEAKEQRGGEGQGADEHERIGLKQGGNPANPNDYIYPKVGEPPNDPRGQRIRELIMKYSTIYNVPPQLMFNKAHVETGGTWKTELRSNKGATGLFQIMPATANGLVNKNVNDLEQNIAAACELTSILLQQANGDILRAEIGWNWKPKEMSSQNTLPLETWKHLNKVFPGWNMGTLRNRAPKR